METQLIRSSEISGGPQAVSGTGDCFVRKFGQSLRAVEPDYLNLLCIDKTMEYLNSKPEVLEITVRYDYLLNNIMISLHENCNKNFI